MSNNLIDKTYSESGARDTETNIRVVEYDRNKLSNNLIVDKTYSERQARDTETKISVVVL